ncbi:MAG: hypothetical protein IPM26_11615 [Saprospiraceae bacterium]|nr:hypothetical protein [Saprospiraceae bacterium]
MLYLKIIIQILAGIMILISLSCKTHKTVSVSEKIIKQDSLSINPIKQESNYTEAPGIVPGDHELLLKFHNSTNPRWTDFYDYYKNHLDKERGKHYFDNLEWMNISFMVEFTDFQSAPSHIKQEIWDGMSRRKVINNPEVAYKLIMYLQVETHDDKATAKRACSVWQINENHYKNNPALWADLQIKHHDSYQKLYYLTLDSFGNNLCLEP